MELGTMLIVLADGARGIEHVLSLCEISCVDVLFASASATDQVLRDGQLATQ